MQQAIDEAGNIWNVDAQGNPVSFAGNANQQQGMQIKPADPARQYAAPSAAADLEGQRLTNQERLANLEDRQRGSLPKGYRWGVGPDGKPMAELIPGVPGPNAGGRPKLTAKEYSDAVAAYQSAIKLRKSADDMKAQFDKTIGRTGGLTGFLDYFPSQEKDVFNSMGGRNRGDLKRSQGFTGGEGNTLGESSQLYDPYTPTSWDRDKNALSKIQALRDLADETEQKSIMMLGGVPDANGNITPLGAEGGPTVLPRAAGAQADPGIGPTGVTSEGGLRYEQGLAGLPDAVANMVGQGAQASEITAFLNQQYAPFGASVGPDMAAAIGTLVQRHRADPRAPVKSLNTGWENFAMLPGRQESTMLGRAADTDVGNFVMHGANAATAGIPGYLAGDQGAAVLDASSQARPLSSLAGEVVGGTSALVGLNSAAGALGRAAPLLRGGGGIGADVIYGTTRGGFENGPAGALTGAIAAGVGNKLGSGIANTTGRIVRGVSDPAVNALAERGVPMSLGSLLGNRSIPGKLINRFESAPIIGDMFAARRADSIDAFNREAFNDAVAPLGGRVASPGREGMNEALGIVDEGYRNALGDTAVDTVDPGFRDAITASRSRMAAIPTIGEELTYNFDNNVAPLFEDGINGERLQAALRNLREMQAGYAGQPMGQAAREVVGEAEGALRGLVAGQRPDVLPKLDAANAAYRNVSTLADAVNTATNNKGVFTPAQLGRSAVNNTKKFGGRMKAAKGDVPFARLQEAAQDVLPSTYPDSGTAGRLLSAGLPTVLGGGGVAAGAFADPTVAGTLAMLAALSSKSGAKIAQKALTGRGPTARAVGTKLINQRRKAGLFGASAGVAMLPQFSQ